MSSPIVSHAPSIVVPCGTETGWPSTVSSTSAFGVRDGRASFTRVLTILVPSAVNVVVPSAVNVVVLSAANVVALSAANVVVLSAANVVVLSAAKDPYLLYAMLSYNLSLFIADSTAEYAV